jgi:hypothetical protein
MRSSVDELVQSVRDALGDEAFDASWTAGEVLSAEAAVEIALETP